MEILTWRTSGYLSSRAVIHSSVTQTPQFSGVRKLRKDPRSWTVGAARTAKAAPRQQPAVLGFGSREGLGWQGGTVCLPEEQGEAGRAIHLLCSPPASRAAFINTRQL